MEVPQTQQSSLTGYADGECSTTTMPSKLCKQFVLYSLLPYQKYRETEGIKDIGLNDWNQGRTQEIKERYVHLGGEE